jgi:peptide methionine sulfoxide reductase msrA/msrB
MLMNKINSLTPTQLNVLINKGTDRPFSSSFIKPEQQGTFLCRQCGLALFRAAHQFASSCGWPSFDGQIAKAISEIADPDGVRKEIICSRCKGHLGHVFRGEGYTQNSVRHCVNQTSFDFVINDQIKDSSEIIVAGGCFWGIEHFMAQQEGVVKTEVGYIGGHLDVPNYNAVCTGRTGHYEAVRVLFDDAKITLEQILKTFFELHDPFQADGQGVDKGPQYRSAVFVFDQQQQKCCQALIDILQTQYNRKVATEIKSMSTFWAAEDYHQQYFIQHPSSPVCHRREKRF